MATDVTIRPEYSQVALPGAKVPPFVHRHNRVGHDSVSMARVARTPESGTVSDENQGNGGGGAAGLEPTTSAV